MLMQTKWYSEGNYEAAKILPLMLSEFCDFNGIIFLFDYS